MAFGSFTVILTYCGAAAAGEAAFPGAAGFLAPARQYIGSCWNSVKPGVDFLLIALIIYLILYFLRGTRAVNILAGIGIILLSAVVLIRVLNLEVIRWLLDSLWPMFCVAIVIVFQPELRRAFAQLGSPLSVHRKVESEAIEEIVKAVVQMSQRYCGALIVFEGKIGMAYIINSAVTLDIRINSLLVQSLFYPNSPLHDGAVIVKDGKIVAAHAILPLSRDLPSSQNIGTRHRAAIGMTEETDAVAVVVSEETGTISVAFHGRLIRNIGEADLLAFLKNRIVDPAQKSRLMDKFEEMVPTKPLALPNETGETPEKKKK